MEKALNAFGTHYSNPFAQQLVLNTIPLVNVMQTGLEIGEESEEKLSESKLKLCYGVLKEVNSAYKTAQPFATGYLRTLSDEFVSETQRLLDKKANADEIQAFVLNAAKHMQQAATAM